MKLDCRSRSWSREKISSTPQPGLSETIMKRNTPALKQPRDIEIGGKVLMWVYRNSKTKWVIGEVVKKIGPVTYHVKVGNKIWKRHIDQMLEISNSNIN